MDTETMSPEERAVVSETSPDTTPAPASEPAKADPAPVADTPKAEPAKADETPKAETGKPPPGYVPIGALHETRAQMKAMRDELAALKKGAEPPPPNPDEQPIEYIKAQGEKLKQFEEYQRQQQENAARQARHEQFMGHYRAQASEFAAKAPEFKDAYQHLVQSRNEELIAAGVEDPRERIAMIQQDEAAIAWRAIQGGRNPAEVLFEVAKRRGWKKADPAPDPKADAGKKMDTLEKGTQAAKSLGALGGKAETGLTLEAFAAMSEDEIAKLSPDEISKVLGG